MEAGLLAVGDAGNENRSERHLRWDLLLEMRVEKEQGLFVPEVVRVAHEGLQRRETPQLRGVELGRAVQAVDGRPRMVAYDHVIIRQVMEAGLDAGQCRRGLADAPFPRDEDGALVRTHG